MEVLIIKSLWKRTVGSELATSGKGWEWSGGQCGNYKATRSDRGATQINDLTAWTKQKPTCSNFNHTKTSVPCGGVGGGGGAKIGWPKTEILGGLG
jgi:hypothetical protein